MCIHQAAVLFHFPIRFPASTRSAGWLPFHLSSCMFNPLLSSLLAHLRLCPACIVHMFIFPPLLSKPHSSCLSLIPPAQSSPQPHSPSINPSAPHSSSPSLSPKDKHSTGWTLSFLHQPPCSPGRQRVCSRIRSGFVPLRKEGTNQTLICRCILCLMERS